MADDVGVGEHPVVVAGQQQDRRRDVVGAGQVVIGQVGVPPVAGVVPHRVAGSDHLADVPVVVGAAGAADVGHPLVGDGLQVVVLVHGRAAAAPHEAEHVAGADVALAVGQVHQAGHSPVPGELRAVGEPRIQEIESQHVLEHRRAVDELGARPGRHARGQRDAVAGHAGDAGQPAGEQAHHERQRAEAVRDDVHPAVADVLAQFLDRGREVVVGDVVQGVGVRLAVVREPVAHPEVERPHVGEPVVQQVADQVADLGHDEHVAGRRQAVHEQDDVIALGPAEPGQAKSQVVLGGERVRRHLGVGYPVEGVPGDAASHLSSKGSVAATVHTARTSGHRASWKTLTYRRRKQSPGSGLMPMLG